MDTDLPLRIKTFNAKRKQDILSLKYKAMAENPFRFFRGTCHLYYEYLLKSYPFPSSPISWICGDLHIENFGSYKGENRLVYFDINDFDEAIRGPVLYDIARLVTSFEVAANEIGLVKKEKNKSMEQLLQHYTHTLIKNKSQNIEKETARGLIKKLIRKVVERTETDLLVKRTNNNSKNVKLQVTERLFKLPKNEKQNLAKEFREWFFQTHHKDYSVTDSGFRIAGTGSIGIKRYLLLLENATNAHQMNLIDVKQSLPSSILEYTKLSQPAWQNEATRIIKVQEMMQHVAPAFLSSFQYQNDWYVVKEIQPTADKISISHLVKQPRHVENYLADLGILTASAQLRSSGMYNTATSDELKQFGKDESWITILKDWSLNYAEQVQKDYKVFLTAWEDGYFAT